MWAETAVQPYSIIRKGVWKLIDWYETGQKELCNLAKDISETNELAATMLEKTTALFQELNQWLQQVNAQRPKLNPQFTG